MLDMTVLVVCNLPLTLLQSVLLWAMLERKRRLKSLLLLLRDTAFWHYTHVIIQAFALLFVRSKTKHSASPIHRLPTQKFSESLTTLTKQQTTICQTCGVFIYISMLMSFLFLPLFRMMPSPSMTYLRCD